jgi:AAA domain
MNEASARQPGSGMFPHVPAAREYEHLRPQNFADWSAGDPPEREWLVEGLIPMGTVTFISGDGGLGKTLLAQQLVMAAALGASWCGKPGAADPVGRDVLRRQVRGDPAARGPDL